MKCGLNIHSQVVMALPFSISPDERMYPAPAKINPNPNLRANGGRVGLENPIGDVPRTGRESTKIITTSKIWES